MAVSERNRLLQAGANILLTDGVWVRRSSRGEDVAENYSRGSTVDTTDRGGATVTAATDVIPIHWLDRDADGARETPTVYLTSTAAAEFYVDEVSPRIERLALYGAVHERGTSAAGSIYALVGAGGSDPELRVECDGASGVRAALTNAAGSVSTASTLGATMAFATGNEVEWIAVADFDNADPDLASKMRAVLYWRPTATSSWSSTDGNTIMKDASAWSLATGEGRTRFYMGATVSNATPSKAYHLRHVLFRHTRQLGGTTTTVLDLSDATDLQVNGADLDIVTGNADTVPSADFML